MHLCLIAGFLDWTAKHTIRIEVRTGCGTSALVAAVSVDRCPPTLHAPPRSVPTVSAQASPGGSQRVYVHLPPHSDNAQSIPLTPPQTVPPLARSFRGDALPRCSANSSATVRLLPSR